MKKRITLRGIDIRLLLLILILLAYGSVMVFSASGPYAKSNHGDEYYFVRRQIFWAIIGISGMLVCAALPYELHKKYTAKIGFCVAFILLIVVLFMGGAIKRWINIGPISLQPSEMMKPMLILVLAAYMEKYQDKIKHNGIYGKMGKIADKRAFWRSSIYGVFIPVGIVFAVCIFIMLENHFSGTLITFCIGAIVIFSGGAMLRWFAFAGSGVCIAVFAVLFGTDYASERIDIWLHPESFSVSDETWQITQGLIAIGSGGFFGTGLGNGMQKQLYVSAAHNDFIFSIVCEELGLIGAVAVIVLFFLLAKRTLALATESETLFASLVAVGIIGHISLQAFLNIGVVTGTIPNTGVTLPFFSYGGSALVVLLCESGILLSVTKSEIKKSSGGNQIENSIKRRRYGRSYKSRYRHSR